MKPVERFFPALAVTALCAVLAPLNPVDVIARGKFVRHFQTREGEVAATVCLPATTEAERQAQLAELPTMMVDLQQAGAVAVAFDFPANEVPPATYAATSLPVVVGAAAAGASVSLPAGVRVAHRETTSWGPANVVIGTPARGSTADLAPLAAEALALHRGAAPPRYEGDQMVISDQGWPVGSAPHTFMPVLIPFLDWGKPTTWAAARGRTVFVGACRLDRDLTRYGRQPGVVAHGELFETFRDGLEPRDATRLVDVLAALASTAAAAASRAWHPRFGPLLLGVAATGLVAWAQLSGLWVSLSGILGGAAFLTLKR